jgi:ribose-phosphate pyrophosphokinase
MNVHLVSTVSSEPFARRLAQRLGVAVSGVERRPFPDGERYLRLDLAGPLDLVGRHVVVVGATDSEESLDEVYRLACTASKDGARSLVLVIPYFGYSTMERAVRAGESVAAKTVAVQLSTIPRAAQGNQVLLMDLHSPGIVHYFEGETVALEISAAPLVLERIRGLGLRRPCMASTDMGRAKLVELFANQLQVPVALIQKERTSGSETRVTNVLGDVKGMDVVIYDDMIRTGSSLTKAAHAYMEAGAASVHAVTTHLVLADGAIERIGDAPLARVIGTDSHPRHRLVSTRERFEIVPVADLFADVVGRLVA